MRVHLSFSSAVVALCLACATSTPAAPTEPLAPAPPVAWQPFGQAAFDQAKREHKWIFVEAGIEGCTACRWMHELTLTDDAVRRRLAADFISLQVDADQQPDLGARFEPWGWPALVFFRVDDNGAAVMVRAIAGNKNPANFRVVLDEVTSGVVTPVATSTAPAMPSLCRAATDTAVAWVKKTTANDAGFVHVTGAPALLLFERSSAFGDDPAAAVALAHDVIPGLIDPVWGGLFVGGTRDFKRKIPEKRIDANASSLALLALAHHQSGDPVTLKAAVDVHRWMRDFLTDSDGSFFSTQEDAAPHLNDLSSQAYYERDDAGRRAFGVPPVDHGSYTDQNARAVSAYLALAAATGDAQWTAVAERAGRALLLRQRPAGYVAQAVASTSLSSDQRMRRAPLEDRPFLRAQGEAGLAFVNLYSATGDVAFKDAAARIAAALRDLEDEAGGFYPTTARDSDALLGRQKQLVDNAVAARFLLRLAALTHDDAQKVRAHRALQATLSPAALDAEGPSGAAEVAAALIEDDIGFVDVSVVGDGEAAQALLASARRVLEVRKLVHLDVEHRYPAPSAGKAQAFICSATACSSPISDPAKVRETIQRFARAESASCR